MSTRSDDGTFLVESEMPGPVVCIAYGVHGDERPPIDAGQLLQSMFDLGALALSEGKLLVLFANPLATAANKHWSQDGTDLNHCFHPGMLVSKSDRHEERRAREIVEILEREEVEILVDFHSTLEKDERLCVQHPGAADDRHLEITRLLTSKIVLSDPGLILGGASLDQHMSTTGRVGVYYQTGRQGDGSNTPVAIRNEMVNLLAGLGMIDGRAFRTFPKKRHLELTEMVECREQGFQWNRGVGKSLQTLDEGTLLGTYANGNVVILGEDSTLVFPEKAPDLVQVGKPLVFLAQER